MQCLWIEIFSLKFQKIWVAFVSFKYFEKWWVSRAMRNETIYWDGLKQEKKIYC